MNKHLLLKQKLYLGLIVLIIGACSEYKPISCPDHGKNINYSKVKKDYPKFSRQFRNKKNRNLLAFNLKNELSINKKRKKIARHNNRGLESVAEKHNDFNNKDKSLLMNFHDEDPPILIASNDRNIVFPTNYYKRNLNKNSNNNYTGISFNNHSPVNKIAIKEPKKQLIEINYNNQNKTPYDHKRTNELQGLAVASLVTGIVGFFVFGIPLGAMAIVFGTIALSKIKSNPGLSGKGMAIAGLILGIIDIIGALVVINLLM
jgi:hypothetical protein